MSKMPIFCIKSVKIYTGQKKLTRIYPWNPWQISGMVSSLSNVNIFYPTFPSQVVGFLSMFAIFISTVILTLDTLPYFQVDDTLSILWFFRFSLIFSISLQPEGDGLGEPYQPFVIIEAVYMGWFTLEFFVRFDIWDWIIWYLIFEIA